MHTHIKDRAHEHPHKFTHTKWDPHRCFGVYTPLQNSTPGMETAFFSSIGDWKHLLGNPHAMMVIL